MDEQSKIQEYRHKIDLIKERKEREEASGKIVDFVTTAPYPPPELKDGSSTKVVERGKWILAKTFSRNDQTIDTNEYRGCIIQPVPINHIEWVDSSTTKKHIFSGLLYVCEDGSIYWLDGDKLNSEIISGLSPKELAKIIELKTTEELGENITPLELITEDRFSREVHIWYPHSGEKKKRKQKTESRLFNRSVVGKPIPVPIPVK